MREALSWDMPFSVMHGAVGMQSYAFTTKQSRYSKLSMKF